MAKVTKKMLEEKIRVLEEKFIVLNNERSEAVIAELEKGHSLADLNEAFDALMASSQALTSAVEYALSACRKK